MITANMVPNRVLTAGNRIALLMMLLNTKGNTKIANTNKQCCRPTVAKPELAVVLALFVERLEPAIASEKLGDLASKSSPLDVPEEKSFLQARQSFSKLHVGSVSRFQ